MGIMPDSADLVGATVTVGEFKTELQMLARALSHLSGSHSNDAGVAPSVGGEESGYPHELDVSGEITFQTPVILVDAPLPIATDWLKLNAPADGLSAGQIAFLYTNTGLPLGYPGSITVKHGSVGNAGEFLLTGAADFLLVGRASLLIVCYNGTNWIELTRWTLAAAI